ncbi:MAG: hypothetical protein ABIS18_07380 [Actinomycetota bacterium]
MFLINVAADAPEVVLLATKSYMTWDLKVVPFPASHVADLQRFDLSYIHWSQVAPYAVNSSLQSNALTVTMYSAAPNSTTMALAHLHDGSILALTLDTDYSGVTGVSRWSGNAVVEQGTAEGMKRFKSCILGLGAGGNCDSPGSQIVYSAVEPISWQPYFWVDNTAPTILAISPVPVHNTIDTTPTISFSISDALSGVSWSSLAIDLDGARVANGTSGFTPSTPLSLGVHTASVSAADLAGNISVISWQFNIIRVDAGDAAASLQTTLVSVNPTGEVLNAPKTVTFNNVAVTLTDYPLTITSSPFTGHGSISRKIWAGGVNVVFENESGIPNDGTLKDLGYLTFTERIALILGGTQESVADITKRTVIVPSVTVDVPVGYNTAGSTARLITKSWSAEGPTFLNSHDDPLPHDLPQVPLTVTATVTAAALTINEGDAGAISVSSGNSTAISVKVNIAGVSQNAFQDQDIPFTTDGKLFDVKPALYCSAGGHSCVAKLDPSDLDPYLAKSRAWISLGDGTIKFFANHWLYRESMAPNYIDWYQTSANVDPTIGCLNSFTNSSLSTGVPSWGVNQHLASPTDTSFSTTSFPTTLSWPKGASTPLGALSNTATADPESEFSLDATDLAGPTAKWQLRSGLIKRTSDYQQMVSTLEYKATANSTSTLTRSHQFVFTVGQCG